MFPTGKRAHDFVSRDILYVIMSTREKSATRSSEHLFHRIAVIVVGLIVIAGLYAIMTARQGSDRGARNTGEESTLLEDKPRYDFVVAIPQEDIVFVAQKVAIGEKWAPVEGEKVDSYTDAELWTDEYVEVGEGQYMIPFLVHREKYSRVMLGYFVQNPEYPDVFEMKDFVGLSDNGAWVDYLGEKAGLHVYEFRIGPNEIDTNRASFKVIDGEIERI